MNSTPPSSEDTTEPQPRPRRYERSGSDRMISGVCGGLGRYFGIDPALVRVGAVGSILLGGIGLVLYAAAMLLVPEDGQPSAPPGGRERARTIALAATIGVLGLAVGGFGFFGHGTGFLFPVAALGLLGLGVSWWIYGERPAGGARKILRRAGIGVGVLVGCAVLAVASFLASGLGGGAVVAGLVILSGAGLVTAAFAGGARWLVLPALAVAIPLAFVSAAGLNLKGGFGERHVHPASTAELAHGYHLGAGELVVDLRDLRLPPGDQRLELRIGAGHLLLLVPTGVCVTTTADIGAGGVSVFDRDGGGLDVSWTDTRQAPATTPRLVVDADVGVGWFEVSHRGSHLGHSDSRRAMGEVNSACTNGTHAAAA
jgi:phage shock protein PspC (stress-responsive transcriptional regulator)